MSQNRSEQPLHLLRIDTQSDSVTQQIDQLRKKLSPNGNIVSQRGRALTVSVFGEAIPPVEVVKRICQDIAQNGISALLRYCRLLDGADLSAETIRVPAEELEKAWKEASPEYLRSIRQIKENITDFQKAILHKDVRVERPGGYLVERYLPLRRVGVCVPGGAAAYPSSLLMTAVPAQVAGVKQIAVMAPPTAFGSYNADLLAACYEIGVTEVYRMGGAQGVAALAYGVEGIEQVDKIVGPGNLFVALAKREVYGTVDIDSIAGPSEVVVIVDESTRADWTAADLMAQSEHSPGSSILIGWDKAVLDRAVEAIEKALCTIERGDLTRQALESFGAAILTKDQDEACRITNLIAPEHLHIATSNAEALAEKIPCAGAIFLGNSCPVAVGDYAAGPSHVLPTGGTARFASGLTTNDFLRANSILYFDPAGLKNLAPDICRIATVEGLTAHRLSVTLRTEE
ncbi:MAG: histidinol dehydrogenase [Thermoguttaceae bacterium]|nr:histidinol dehydrogenase [Thermoguttaceae bacterium]